MHFFLVAQYAAILAFQLAPAHATPAKNPKIIALVSRAAGIWGDPHIVDMPCTDMEDVCEADCIAILCHGKEARMQKFKGTKEEKEKKKVKNYTRSGAYFVPFNEPADMMKKRGISVPMGLVQGAPVFNSAEETTYESTEGGGEDCIIFPVPRDQQTLQGGNMQNQFGRVDEALKNIPDGDWFKQRFSFLNSDTPHCNALMQDPPDDSICHKEKKNKWGLDMKKFAFVMNKAATNPRTFKNLFGGYKRKRSDGTYEAIEEGQEAQDDAE